MLGLNSEQLLDAFINALQHRSLEFKGELEAIKADESPTRAEALKKMPLIFQSLTEDQLAILYGLLYAFLDTIEQNNIALSKIIPHIDS